MTRWLYEDYPLRHWPLKILNWIAGGEAWWSRGLRLGVVLGGIFLSAYLMRPSQTETPRPWWLVPAWISLGLLVPFAFWRLVEWRRRRERRRNPPARTLNLP